MRQWHECPATFRLAVFILLLPSSSSSSSVCHRLPLNHHPLSCLLRCFWRHPTRLPATAPGRWWLAASLHRLHFSPAVVLLRIHGSTPLPSFESVVLHHRPLMSRPLPLHRNPNLLPVAIISVEQTRGRLVGEEKAPEVGAHSLE